MQNDGARDLVLPLPDHPHLDEKVTVVNIIHNWMTLIIQIRMKVTEKLIWNKSNISLRSRHALKGQPIKHTAQGMPHSVQKFYQCSSKLERTNSAT